ncbi:DUF5617 domain-containing protein [Legionella cardiaca]|uniref:DUF5617 domain-containing protein n=1 Tax=Legionella cardiaca TaxID=1071983 RepID=A0ABY8AT90_9GAMM|nr:DUF5617 domain-containing protein [Legionella cardiaca]WED43877.1 DUF5617 domain-containing protein [Legionella cardiaca]
MPLLSSIDIHHFSDKIKEKEGFFIDSSTLEIPDVPLFSNYEPGNADVRLIAKDSVAALKKQFDDAREIIQLDANDETGIQIALDKVEDLSELQVQYHAILKKMGTASRENFIRTCQSLDKIFALILTNTVSLDEIVSTPTITPIIIPHLDECIEIIRILQTLPEQENEEDALASSLSYFFLNSIFRQAAIVNENKKKLTLDGEQLTEDDIICPFTRKKISVSGSLKSQKDAENFLAIYIALSRLAGAKESDELKSFLDLQEEGRESYLRKANKCLVQYLDSPKRFPFTAYQQQFLNDIGAADAEQQMKQSSEYLHFKELEGRYSHLWDNEKAFTRNVLALLIDYNKQDWCIPALGLFFTAHWNRHHHALVARAIEVLESGKDITETLAELEKDVKKHPKFDAEGSLMRRVAFIRYQAELSIDAPDTLLSSFPGDGAELSADPESAATDAGLKLDY